MTLLSYIALYCIQWPSLSSLNRVLLRLLNLTPQPGVSNVAMFSSCAELAMPVAQATLASTAAATAASSEAPASTTVGTQEEDLVSIMGKLVTVASAAPVYATSAACMAPTLQLVNLLCR
jgi:hypothetical protein